VFSFELVNVFYILFRLISGFILYAVSSQQFCVPNGLDCLASLDVLQSSNFYWRCLELQLYSSVLYIFVLNVHVMMFVLDCLFSFPSKKCDFWFLFITHASFPCAATGTSFLLRFPFQCAFNYALTRVITFFIKMLVSTGVTYVSQCIANFHNHFAYFWNIYYRKPLTCIEQRFAPHMSQVRRTPPVGTVGFSELWSGKTGEFFVRWCFYEVRRKLIS
jgi:hypothetical protein